MSVIVGAAVGVAVLGVGAAWLKRRLPDRAARARLDRVEAAIAALPAFGRDAPSLERLLAATRDAAIDGFGATDALFFEPGLFQRWDARALGEEDARILEPPDEAAGQVFAWVAQRGGVLTKDELAGVPDSVLGPLRGVLEDYGLDALVPLTDRGEVLGVLGLVGVRPHGAERELLESFRSILAATAANVRLDRETAEALGLEAAPSEVARVRGGGGGPSVGREGPVSWATGLVSAGDAPEAFAVATATSDGAVVASIGLPVVDDAAARPLVGVSLGAAALATARAAGPDPARTAAALERVIAHAPHAARATAATCVLEASGKLRHAGAAHPPAYVLDKRGLRALGGAGPLLGDGTAHTLVAREHVMETGAVVVMVGDGIVGAEAPGGERFGHRQLQLAIAGLGGKTAVEVRDAVLAAVESFRDGGRPLADEACVVLRWE